MNKLKKNLTLIVIWTMLGFQVRAEVDVYGQDVFDLSPQVTEFLERLPRGSLYLFQNGGQFYEGTYVGRGHTTVIQNQDGVDRRVQIEVYQFANARPITPEEFDEMQRAGTPVAPRGATQGAQERGSGAEGGAQSPAGENQSVRSGSNGPGGNRSRPNGTGEFFGSIGRSATNAAAAEALRGAFMDGLNRDLGRAHQGFNRALGAQGRAANRMAGATQRTNDALTEGMREASEPPPSSRRDGGFSIPTDRGENESGGGVSLARNQEEALGGEFAGFTSTDPNFRNRADDIWTKLRNAVPNNFGERQAQYAGFRTLEAADSAWVASDFESSEILLTGADLLADFAIGANPVTSVPRDLYEVIYGYEFKLHGGGRELNFIERGIAGLSLAITLGTGTQGAPIASAVRMTGQALYHYHRELRARAAVAILHAEDIVRVFTRARVSPREMVAVIRQLDQQGVKFILGIPDVRRLPSGEWVSRRGLRYGSDFQFPSRLSHVVNHGAENAGRAAAGLPHSIFQGDVQDIPRLLDEAWFRRGAGYPSGNNYIYDVDMGRVIGTRNERTVRIVVKGKDDPNVVTSFPVSERPRGK